MILNIGFVLLESLNAVFHLVIEKLTISFKLKKNGIDDFFILLAKGPNCLLLRFVILSLES